jgi:hypothetical protein
MIRRLILLLFFVSLSAVGCYAQAVLGIGKTGVDGIPDSIVFGKVIRANYYIKNIGNQPYTGPLFTNWKTTKTTREKVDTTKVNNFSPGDSVLIDFNLESSQVAFNNGSNIIVIWPTGTSIPTADSAFKPIYITNVSGIYENKNELVRVSIFPNPANNLLNIDVAQESIGIQSVNIANIEGRVILSVTNNFKNPDVSDLSPGVYFITVRLNDGRIGKYKLIKSE